MCRKVNWSMFEEKYSGSANARKSMIYMPRTAKYDNE